VLVAFDDLEMVPSMKIVPVQLFQVLGQHCALFRNMLPTASQHLLRSIGHCTPNSEHDGNTELAPEVQRPSPTFLLLLRILDILLYRRFYQGLVSCDFDIRHQNHQIPPLQSRRLLAGVVEEKQCPLAAKICSLDHRFFLQSLLRRVSPNRSRCCAHHLGSYASHQVPRTSQVPTSSIFPTSSSCCAKCSLSAVERVLLDPVVVSEHNACNGIVCRG
jgi:hypothetical protein